MSQRLAAFEARMKEGKTPARLPARSAKRKSSWPNPVNQDTGDMSNSPSTGPDLWVRDDITQGNGFGAPIGGPVIQQGTRIYS